MSWWSSRSLQDVLIKTNIIASVIRPQKASSRHLQDVLVYVFKVHCKNLLKTSWQDVLKMSKRSLQEVFKMYHQVKLFLLTCLGDVFKTFLRRTAKTVFFSKKLHCRCSAGLKIGFSLKVWNIELTLVPSFKLSQENTQPENMWQRFWKKAKGRGGTVNWTSVYA